VPPDHGLRLDNEEQVPPSADEAPQEDPEHPVGVFEADALDAALQHQDLLAEHGVLDGEAVSVRGSRDEQGDQGAEDFHRPRLPESSR
jgi:hypothetical protein